MNKINFNLHTAIPKKTAEFIVENFNILNKEQIYTYDFFESKFFSEDTQCAVISNEKQIFGAAILKFNFYSKGKSPWVMYFIVDQTLKRKSLGTKLLNGIKKRFEKIRLECWNDNEEALAFYKKQDFKKFFSTYNSVYLIWKKTKKNLSHREIELHTSVPE